MSASRDIVVLVPGILGFDRQGALTHFAGSASMLIGERLELELGRRIPVFTFDSHPTGSLEARQASFLRQLQRVASEPERRIHLVAHGAGGLDAVLALGKTQMDGRPWREPFLSLRERIKSIVAIASPMDGTGLAEDAIVDELVFPPALQVDAQRELWSALTKLWKSFERASFGDRVARSIAKNPLGYSGVVARMLVDRRLLRDLRPQNVRSVLRVVEPDRTGCRIHTLAVLAARRTDGCRQDDGPSVERLSDTFFDWIRARTERPSGDPPEPSPQAVTRIAEAVAAGPIGNPTAVLPPVDAMVSDGVVNTARQIFDPSNAEELLGVVIADHLDVIGYYDGARFVRDEHGQQVEHHVRAGVLRSGSCFQWGELQAAYRRVADAIYARIRALGV